MLQKYDLEREESQREFHAAVMGAEFKDTPKTAKPPPSNGRKQTMTRQDIMRSYAK